MASDPKTSPNERLMRKRLAARLRQQRCRARKKELAVSKKQREQQEAKGAAHVPAQPRKPILVPRNHAAPVLSRGYAPQLPHRPHQTHQPHQPHRPHLPHHAHRPHPVHRIHRQAPPPPPHSHHAPLPPPPHHRHHPQPLYAAHRPVRAVYMTELPTRTQSIGSVVSFDDGSCPVPKAFDAVPPPPLTFIKQEHIFKATPFSLPPIPTVSPTMSSKPIVEPDSTSSMLVPSRSPTKEETAIDAMLSLRSASFGA